MDDRTCIALGGEGFEYDGTIDWTDNQLDLADAIIQTATRAREHLLEALSFYRGVTSLVQSATPATILGLASASPVLRSLLANDPSNIFALADGAGAVVG